MSAWKSWRPVGPRNVAADVDDEIAFHVDELTRELKRQGLSSADARTEALRRFGSPESTRSALLTPALHVERRARRVEWLGEVLQDLRFGIRQSRRQPGFTFILLLVLSLGIGAHAAIITAFRAVLLKPLPYPEADRLVHLWETAPDLQGGRSEASFPDFEDWRVQTRNLFSGLEGYDPTNMAFTGRGSARMLQGGRVTAGFLELLGVRPALGRGFRPGEDLPGGAPVVVLGHGFWLREFGGDSTVLGQTVTLNGRVYEVVGVLPQNFHFVSIGSAELLVPLDRAPETRAQRYNHWLRVVGRTRPGVEIAQARAGVATVVARLATTHAESHQGRSSLLVPLRDELTGPVRPVLMALAGAVIVLLLVACTNAGSLLLARTMTRMPELRVRAAIGAGRSRLLRQLVTEAVAVALVAGAVGAFLASIGLRLLVGAIPAGVLSELPALSDLSLDWRILGYTLIVSLIIGIAFGVIPGFRLTRRLAPGSLRVTTRSGVRDLLVTGQLALTTVLLVVAGLLTRSLLSLVRADPGFRPDQVVTVRYSLSGPAYAEPPRLRLFADAVLAQVRAIPGVQAVGAITSLPLQGGGTNTFRVEGRPEPSTAERPEVTMRGVAGEYFQTMGIRLAAGRVLGPDDTESHDRVLLLSESIARRLFGTPDSAVGARVRFYAFPDAAWTVVGVVGDVKTGRLDEPAPATAYYSHLQNAENRLSVVARTTGDPAATLAAVERAMAALDAGVPVYAAETLRDRVAHSPAVFLRRYPLILIGGFALVALVLSAAGLYGVVAFAVTSRQRELGVRSALGATPRNLVRLMLSRGGYLAAVGIAGGVAAAVLASRAVARLLYGVPALDPLTCLGVTAGLGMITLVATWVPARRAARLDPLIALKQE